MIYSKIDTKTFPDRIECADESTFCVLRAFDPKCSVFRQNLEKLLNFSYKNKEIYSPEKHKSTAKETY